MRQKLGFFVTLTAMVLVLYTCYFLYMEIDGNFHPITESEAYRSGQLNGHKLKFYIEKYKIKSVLNLRGEKPSAGWYREELRVSAENSVKHYDFRLSASREPTEGQVRNLIEIFRKAPRPILIHCEGGADRVGLAAAIWKVVIDEEPKSVAKKQLSIRYFHLPIRNRYAMNRFFEKWIPE